MSKFLIILLFILLVGCQAISTLPKNIRSEIPDGANKVIVSFDMSKDSLFLYVSEFLANENFRIYNLNKEIGFINTDGKRYGSEMEIRLNIVISENGNNSKLSCISEFNLSDSSGEFKENKWWQSNISLGGYFTLCFDKMVLLLQKLHYTDIQYLYRS